MGLDACNEIFEQLDRELWLITARAGDSASGLIATYISKVSLVPDLPRVALALAKHHFTHKLIEQSNCFAMHLIGEEQLDRVWQFGIPSGSDVDKLSGLATSLSITGAPLLSDAIAWLDCRVEDRMDTGDRTIFLAEVVDCWHERPVMPLTFKRLLQLASADKLAELKQGMDHDVAIDRAAILDWRGRKTQR